MLWDCSRCGTDKLLGLDHRFCPGCGAPQDPERRYYPEDNDKIAVEDHAYTGADLACPACDTANASKAVHCVGCGSPMEGGGEVKTREEQSSDTAGDFDGDSASEARQEHRDAKLKEEEVRKADVGPQEAPESGRSGAGKAAFGLGALGLIGAVVVAFVLCCGVMMWSRDADLVVTGHSWERSVQIEVNKKVSKSDWKDKIPTAATDVRCKKKQKGTNKIADGESCKTVRSDNGDGTFKETEKCTTTYREEPTYSQHCDYRVKEWTTVRTPKASGRSLAEAPKWPKFTTKPGEREGQKSEVYTVDLVEEDGSTHSCTTGQESWSGFAMGSEWTGSIGRVTGSVSCGDLDPAGS